MGNHQKDRHPIHACPKPRRRDRQPFTKGNFLEIITVTPKQNTILYEKDPVEGIWAYVKECPTTRAFGKTENEAWVNLVFILIGKTA